MSSGIRPPGEGRRESCGGIAAGGQTTRLDKLLIRDTAARGSCTLLVTLVEERHTRLPRRFRWHPLRPLSDVAEGSRSTTSCQPYAVDPEPFIPHTHNFFLERTDLRWVAAAAGLDITDDHMAILGPARPPICVDRGVFQDQRPSMGCGLWAMQLNSCRLIVAWWQPVRASRHLHVDSSQ
jgi:hypothetical protein